MKTRLMIATLCFSSMAFAAEDHKHTTTPVSPTFQSLKALIGTWEGQDVVDGKKQNVKVTYELTSGGTAIAERLMPGTEYEMLTVYANNGNTVTATHFSLLGNQPQMALKKAADGVYAFELEGSKGISDKNDLHTHSLTLTLSGKTLKQEWTNYLENKKGGDTKILQFTKKI